MTGWLPEIRLALRGLLLRPALSAVVVATLALGIGANSAVFSVANAVLLAPLPYHQPERLVRLWETVRRATVERRSFSYLDFEDLEARSRSFSSLAAYDTIGLAVAAAGAQAADATAVRVIGELVSPRYFSTLGVAPLRGRTFDPGGDAAGADAAAGAIVGYGLSQRLFGSAEAALGNRLRVDDTVRTVVGVMPPGFAGVSDGIELWLPFDSIPPARRATRDHRTLSAVGRLRPEAELAAVNSELEAIFAGLEAEHPTANRGYRATAVPLAEALVGSLQRPVLVLLTAVACVLLIACTNVANLVLARALGRRRETVIRAALGASRGQLLAHAQAEILVLSLLGGGVGLLVCLWGLDLLRRLVPIAVPSFVAVGVDGRVLGFTLVLALLVGLALGLVAAFTQTAGTARPVVRSDNRWATTSRGQRRFRSGLVVAQTALALLLLIGAGLMIRSFVRMRTVDTGFDAERLVTLRYDRSAAGRDAAGSDAFASALRTRLAALPAVEAVTLASDLPFSDQSSATVLSAEGASLDPGAVYDGAVRSYRHRVDHRFFATLGIPLLAGRGFTAADLHPDARSAVVSRALASRLFGAADPLGRRFKLGRPLADPTAAEAVSWRTVVGVAADVRYRTLTDDASTPDDPDLYLPIAGPSLGSAAVAVRTAQDPASLLAAVRRTAAATDPAVPVFALGTGASRIAAATARARFSAALMGVFAALALALAGIGIYGVMSYAVSCRNREIGIRMVLGAEGRRVLRQIVGEGMTLVAAGSAIGLAAALALARLLAASLYQVSATDPAIFALATGLLAAAAWLGCYLPARRASRLEPTLSLRQD